MCGAGTRLLVHAAAGGVGLLVCAWARRLGAIVIGTVSSEDKARVAREYGCEHPIVDAATTASPTPCRRACGGADVVIDGLGDAAREENFAALARRGHWISLGQASGALQPLSADRAGGEVDHLLAPGGVRLRREPTPTWPTRAARVWQALADGTLQAPPIERHALDAADEAHRAARIAAHASARWC